MAWSETMFIIQHFYNVFNIDERLTNLEYKTPLMARSIEGKPENVAIEELTPGTLWFIKDNNNSSVIKALSILTENNTFAAPIPFSVDLNNVTLENDIKNIIENMDLTAENYYDIIKLMLEILTKIPVERGGTGRTSISKNKMLIGDANNTFKEIGFDGAPTERSENLINSGAVFEFKKQMAPKQHASPSNEYGVGTESLYGHLKITDDYENAGNDPSKTAISIAGLAKLLENFQNSLNVFKIIDGNMLFSGYISAYRAIDMRENELRLIDSYFNIELNSTGNYTLKIK